MATELTVQSERAYQKQPHIFANAKSKRVKSKSSRVGKGGRRWYKDVGLGFRTPKTAIEGSYIGKAVSGTAFVSRLLKHGSDNGMLQTRNAPSPAWSRSEAVSLPALSSQPKCTALSSSDVNTSTLSLNTPDTRSDIRIWLRMYHRLSVWRKAIRLQSGNADL